MFIKYESIGDVHLVHIPEHEKWSIFYRLFDDECCENGGVYLKIGSDDPIGIFEADRWLQGRPNLPFSAVSDLHEAIVNRICEMVAVNSNLAYIDTVEVQNKLINEKYGDLWLEKGFVTKDENGLW